MTIIIWKIFFPHCLSKSQESIDRFISHEEYEGYVPYELKSFSYENYYNSILHTNVLKRYVCLINQSPREIIINSYIVSKNDNLNDILKKYDNIDSDEISLLLQHQPVLRNLNAGQLLSWVSLTHRNLKCLIWSICAQEIRVYSSKFGNFTESIIRILNKSNNDCSCMILFTGELIDNFINSVHFLGLDEDCIKNIISALQYQLDFKKLHYGDRFAILVLMKMHNSNNNIVHQLLGVRLHTAGKDYYVFRANDGNFYDRKAIKSSENFLPFPILKPFRISSNFNLNRLNPITGQVSPHVGVDFAVPIGTSVLSVGDGEVIIASYSKIAGNYVVIKHNCHRVTRYMHLKKLLVKSGQKVKKGDVIALSGNTGRSTGPHLHFEIWVNHRPVNPLTTKNLNIEKLSGKERLKYLSRVNEILPQLRFD